MVKGISKVDLEVAWMCSRPGTRTKTELDLWDRLLDAASPHQVEWRWVRGLTGIPWWGRVGAASGVGGHLLTDEARGTITFADHLHAHITSDGMRGRPQH